MKKQLLKTAALVLTALGVIGGARAAHQYDSNARPAIKMLESTSVNSTTSDLANYWNALHSGDEFRLIPADEMNSGAEPFMIPAQADGETPALIIGFNEMDKIDFGAGMVSFQSDGGNATLVARLDEQLFWITNAVYADGLYYVSQSVGGNLGFLYDSKDWSPVKLNTNVAATCVPTALAYNPKDKTVYGCFNSTTKNKYDFATFDITTQERISTIASFGSAKYIEMVFDGEGNLYAFKAETINGKANCVVMYKIDTTSGEQTKIGYTGVSSSAFTSAFYDYKNNRMYFLSGPSGCVVYTINPETAESTQIRETPGQVSMRGCYVAEVTIKDDAPNMVTDLQPVFEGPSLSGKLTFNLPEQTYAGVAGTAPIGYKIRINGNEYANVPPTSELAWGQAVEAPVELTELGKYTFEVVAQTSGGEGAPETTIKWIGNDYPSAPKNVTLVYEQPTFYLTWDPVVTSRNNGFLDPDKILYKVFDHAGNAMTNFISDLKWSTTTQNPEDGSRYMVVAYHEGLASDATNSNTIGIVTPPFRELFEPNGNHNDWTYLNPNNDVYKWEIDTSREAGGAYIRSNKNGPNDDYLVTPPLALEGGKYYNLFVEMYTGSSTQTFSIVTGTAPTPEALTNTILDPVTFRTGEDHRTFDCSVHVETTGVYYIALHATSEQSQSGNLYIYDFNLSEALSPEAPDYPALSITDDPDRKLLANLSLTAPDSNIGGGQPCAVTRYDIYRDDALVKTIDNPGKTEAYTDAVPKCGTYKYAVVAYNEAGKGREVRDNVYVGVGIPDKVTRLTMAEHDNTGIIDLNWEAPSYDINGRSIPTDSVCYDVVLKGSLRVGYGSNKTNLTIGITNPDVQQFMYFYVDTYSSAGTTRNSRVYTDMVPVGAPYTFPFQESVPQGAVQRNWSLTGNNNNWGIYNAVGTPECYPQDNDGGLFGWIPTKAGDSAVLISGKVFVSGDNPTASFYYRAISDSKNTIEVMYHEIGNNDWKVLRTISLDETGKDEWVREFVSLDALKGQNVQFGFRGVSEDTRYLICIDNIYMGEIVTVDAGIESIDAPTRANIGKPFKARAIVVNNGVEEIADARLRLVRGDIAVDEIKITLPVGARTEYELNDASVDLFTETDLTYCFEIVADNDRNADNNRSEKFHAELILPTAPAINDLAAHETSAGVSLTWTEPDLTQGNPANIVTEDFEDYKAWEIDRAGDWTFYDVDKQKTVGISAISIPNAYKPAAYMLFDNSKVNETYQANAYGHKYLAAFCSQSDAQGNIHNDNWVVSPELRGIAQTVTFYARTYNDYYGEEEFRFLYSTTDKEISSFVEMAKVDDVPMNPDVFTWQKYSFDLPEGTRYFAIRHVSKDGFIFFLDDITYNAGGGDIRLLGYNVYCDGAQINEAPVTSATFVDNNADKGNHTYHVTALYDLGESALSNPASIDFSSIDNVDGDSVSVYGGELKINVDGANGKKVAVYTVDGRTLANTVAGSSLTIAVPAAGVYIVNVNGTAYKVVVR